MEIKKPLSEKFATQLAESTQALKDKGTTEEQAQRVAEGECQKADEEYDPHGKAVVAAVYNDTEFPKGTVAPEASKAPEYLGPPEKEPVRTAMKPSKKK